MCSTGPLQSQLFCDTLPITAIVSFAAKFTALISNFFRNETPLLHINSFIFSLGKPENRNLPEKFIEEIFPHTQRTLSLKPK